VAIVQKATAAAGRPPKILMSSWSPPAYLKSNHLSKSPTAGTLASQNGAYQYAAFGQWWVSALQAYAAEGVVPDYISIQNEPDYFNAGWETCRFDPVEGATNAGYGPALAAVQDAIAASSLAAKPQVIGPETSGIGSGKTQAYLAGLDVSQLDVVAHHLYNGGNGGNNPLPDSFTAAMTGVGTAAGAAATPIFQTEFAPVAPTLVSTAWLIHDALTVEGVAAYFYWDLIWSPPAAGAPPSGLVTINGAAPSSSYTINDTYYAVKHFARWTDPEWTRVDATSNATVLKASAFLSPDGASLTVVLINADTLDHPITVDAGGFAFASEAVYRPTSAAEGTIQETLDGSGGFTLPASSVATVTFGP
jgi:glucuronoarabinoxylan endo-1,4-beta-xylanase